MAEEKMKFGGGEKKKKGRGLYILIAILILVLGLLFAFSMSNYTTYQLKSKGEKLTLWKGKFTPKGSEQVKSFDPLVVSDTDVRELTRRNYIGRDAAYKAIFGHLMDQIAAESARGMEADLSKLNSLLNKAEDVLASGKKGDTSLLGPTFQLAKTRVAVAEMSLEKAYRKALPVYEEAIKSGLAEAEVLEPTLEAMEAVLGVGAPR